MARCECLNYPADAWVQKLGLGVAAWRLQQRGYAVLPLARGAKKPHRMLPWSGEGKDGVHHATQDYGAVQEWWGKDPAANIGVATGAASGLVVIDLDVKRGNDGPGEFWRFLVKHGLTAEFDGRGLLPYVRTPSGGQHIWLRTPAGVPVPERPGILPGVDAKGDGGFVAAPPSMKAHHAMDRPGEPRGTSEVPVPYVWAKGCPCMVPEAPPWILPWLGTYKQDTAGQAVCIIDGEPLDHIDDHHGHSDAELHDAALRDGAALRDARSASGSPGHPGAGETGDSPDLASLKRTGIPRGQRNAEMYRLACSLFRKHGTGAETSVWVKEELTAVWRAGDRTGFSPGELLTVIDSARRFVQGRQEEDRKIVEKGQEWISRGMRQ